MIKNEPNTNPILPAILSIYAMACALVGKYLCVLCALCGYEQKMQNEPNLKNTKINIKSFTEVNYANFRRLQPRKNEPNTNPILSTDLSSNQLEQKMQNEPNFKNTQMNVTSFNAMNYDKFHRFQHPKNEPNTNPIYRGEDILAPCTAKASTSDLAKTKLNQIQFCLIIHGSGYKILLNQFQGYFERAEKCLQRP